MAISHLLNVDLLTVIFILAINHLIFLIDFINIELVIKYEDWSFTCHEKGVVFLKVRAINTKTLSYLSTDQRETYDLMIDWYEQLFLLLIEVKVRQEWVLNATLDGYLFLVHDNLVSLIDRKLVFGHLRNVYELILGFDDVAVVNLLINCSCWLVHQPYLIILISNDYGIEVRKHLKVRDDLVNGKGKDLRRMSTSVYWKNGDGSFLPTEIKLILFIRILEMLDLLNMHEFFEFYISHTFIIETYLIPSHNADAGKRNNFKNWTNFELVGVDGKFGHYFLRLRPHSFHIE